MNFEDEEYVSIKDLKIKGIMPNHSLKTQTSKSKKLEIQEITVGNYLLTVNRKRYLVR